MTWLRLDLRESCKMAVESLFGASARKHSQRFTYRGIQIQEASRTQHPCPPFSSREAPFQMCEPTLEARDKRNGVALSPSHSALNPSNDQRLCFTVCDRNWYRSKWKGVLICRGWGGGMSMNSSDGRCVESSATTHKLHRLPC